MFHILVAEDDTHTCLLLQTILENAHYTVTPAKDGKEALELLDTHHIDLVILDIMMPRMDGYEVAKIIRDNDDTMPILMVTAKILPEDEKKGFLAGTDDYVTKPIDADTLLLRIKALLRRYRITSEQKITVGDMVLDYNSMTVSRGDEMIELPQKEFLLLYKMLSCPGQIFTRILLMDDISGSESTTDW